MITLRKVMGEFIEVPELGPKEASVIDPVEPAGFPTHVQAIRQQSQRYFWICVVLMIVQFTVLLVVGIMAIFGIVVDRPEWVSVAFGGTATGCR